MATQKFPLFLRTCHLTSPSGCFLKFNRLEDSRRCDTVHTNLSLVNMHPIPHMYIVSKMCTYVTHNYPSLFVLQITSKFIVQKKDVSHMYTDSLQVSNHSGIHTFMV